MQNKLTQLFKSKPNNLLNIFFTAGYPKLEDTTIILKALIDSNVDLLVILWQMAQPFRKVASKPWKME
jgi:tryptophan synthase alpha chain